MWNVPMRCAEDERDFTVTRDGVPLALFRFHSQDEWSYGCVYERELRRTTLSLLESVDPEHDRLYLRVSERSLSLDDVGCDPNVVHEVTYVPHYTQFVEAKCGLVVKAASGVEHGSLELCAAMADVMLAKHPEIGSVLRENGADIALYSRKVRIWDVPEHRFGQLFADRAACGLSGVPGNPTSSLSESNVLRILEGRYKTDFPNENVMAHEFGHAIHLLGIDLLEDKTLLERITSDYERVRAAGLWPNSYAISNKMEYFATLTAIWFDNMSEGAGGTWDGVRGPVNSRDELERYDEVGYALMAEVYPEAHLPAPWDRPTENRYDIDGTPYER